MPDKNRKLIDEFKALGAPAAAPRPRATKVSQFEKDFRNSMAREQAEREQAVKSGLTSWATEIPGTIADLAVDLPYYLGQRVVGRRGDNIRPLGYGERVRAELATALGLQNPPSDEVGTRPPPAHEEITDAISLLNPLAWSIAGDPVGIARAGTKATKSVGKALGKEAGRRINEAMMTGEGMLGSALAPARPNFIKAYHGTPHRFAPTAKNPLGEFDPTKIGTGEGAQSYGYGHYLAEQKDVAKSYANDVAGIAGARGSRVKPAPEESIAYDVQNFLGEDIGGHAAGRAEKIYSRSGKTIYEFEDGSLGSLDSQGNFQAFAKPESSLYKVDLPDEHMARMLDWDAKFESQHPDVQAAILKYWADNPGLRHYGDPTKMTGEGIYGSAKAASLGPEGGAKINLNPSNEAASMDLRYYGIPGIKYFDASSRDIGEGTRNFVVFPRGEDLLTIEERMKKGGTVSQDAMQMQVWDKQVQHKGMGGWMKGVTRTAEEAKRLYEIAKGTRSKAAQEAAGLYHPIGGGIKLSKPVELMQFETVKDPTVKGVQRKIITPEDLQGGIGIPLVGDRAAGGTLLTSVEGIPFRNPLTLEAGPDYMLTHTIPGSPESSIWRSGKGVVSGLQRQVEFARDMGRPIYGVNVVGAPTNVNYNTMVTEAILNQYDPAALTKKAKKEFLKDIRNYTPDPDKPHLKPGSVLTEADLNDVEALRAKMLAEGAGPLRKAFVERMALEPFQKMGFPDVPASRLATTEPLLVDVPTGSAGFTVGTIDPAARALEQTPRGHKTYPVALAGEYFGSLGQPIDYRNVFQEFADKRRLFGKPEGSDWRSFSLSPQFQTFDQEWLDRVMKSAGADKPREWKDGGAVNMAGGGDLIRAGKSLMRMKNRMTAEPFAKPSIIKESGGNWMDEAPERAVAGLKSQRLLEDPDITMLSVRLGHARQLGERSGDWDEYNKLKKRLEEKQTKVEDPLNKWIGTQLARYIRNDLGTPKDPVRGLAEKGTLHFDPEPYRHIYGGELSKRRSAAGYPTTGMAETPLGRAWESQADRSISSQTAENVIAKIRGLGHVPPEWLKKLDPKALVYDANLTYDKLGLNHLIDELKNAISPRGGLPPELMLKPESLSKLSVPQAVERVAKINAWREKQAAEALKAQMEGIPILKEYPEGYQWREVPDVEENERALKFAMDVGCEGGWCTKGETLARQYGGGGNKLFVLHDPKGRAVAQINTFPNEKQYFHDDDAVARFWETHGREPSSRQELLEFDKQHPYINEIKGKFNRPPAPELLPYVQDFVKSGKWSRVNELENAGLYKADPHELGMLIPQDPALRNLPGRRTDDLIKAQQAGLFGENQYLTRQEWEDILRRQIESESGSLPPANDMKEGGAAEQCGCNQDAAQAAKQAGGGAVRKALKAVLPKGQQDILSASESAANLERFLSKSQTSKPVFHVAKTDVKQFSPQHRTELSSMGHHFGTSDQANFRSGQYDFNSQSPNIGKYHLSIQNPLEVSHMASFAPDHLADTMMELNLLKPEKYDALVGKHDYNPLKIGDDLVKILKKNGYDGLKYPNEREGEGFSYVPFDATQIKSAIGNRGTYDPAEADINKASGGIIKKAAKALLPKGQQAILPAAKSAANLEKFLADSAVKDRLYHATPKSFSEFIPGGDNPLRSGPAVWMTPNKFEQPAAHNIRVIPDKPGYMYGNQSGKFTPGTNVMPLHSSIKNPLYSSEATWKQDFEKFGGSPWTLEPSNIQSMKSAGFDGIVYRDRHGDIAEVVAFEPTQVKSAIGNRGTYDPAEADITKAKGGRVTNDAMWMAVQDKQLRKKHGN